MWKNAAAIALLSCASCGSEPDATPDAAADAARDAPEAATDAAKAPDASQPDATPLDASAQPDVTPDASQPDAAVPADMGAITLCSRPLLPVSTTRVTSQRPTLQFSRAPGLRNTRVEVCRERDCRAPVLSVDSPDDYLAVPTNLPAGVYFWRIVPRNAEGDTCTSATWQFTVPARSLTPPRSWGAALDVNGDGYGDLAVASVDAAGATGSVRVYHGSAAGLGDTPAAVYTGLTTRAGAYNAPPVAVPAGDLNGDGFGDLAVGLAAALDGDGQVLVYFGSPRGLPARPDADLRSTEGRHGRFGAALAGVGDIEGDGYADLVVGAPRATATSATDTGVPGRVYAFHGLPNGIRYTPTTTVTGPNPAGGEFGAALAGAGDVNSDRFPDLVVGAPGAARAYVYRGTALGLVASPIATFDDSATAGFGALVGSAGDVDADNHADVFVAGSGPDGRVLVRLAGRGGMFMAAPTVLAAGAAVSAVAAADTNADGYSDVAVGASSRAVVLGFLGSATGLATTPAYTLALPSVAGFGASLASVGDGNRDGASDLAAGGTGGAVAVFHGGATGAPAMARTLTLGDAVRSLGGAWGGL
jgi:hypothetical protein